MVMGSRGGGGETNLIRKQIDTLTEVSILTRFVTYILGTIHTLPYVSVVTLRT